ncbi:unnamed protein product [Allacma fusca]|uniref:Tudor domain-containing protein n=1 Tax=Allacma fusca TaxID=39272 RepID=A0A8J2J4H0_9HEXA|nr:unnamed protein product [Allacma fusca]
MCNSRKRLGVYDNLFVGIWNANEVNYYKILSVQDLDNFVVEPQASTTWLESMQDLYNRSQEGLQIKTTHVFKNYLYAYKDHVSKKWHRVRVDATSLWHGTALVHFIDEGEEKEVYISDLLHLETSFWSIAPLVIKAKLGGIFPPGELPAWPRESIDKFKELCKPGDMFCGVSIHTEGQRISLVLFNNRPQTASTMGGVSLQMYLVELGLARTTERFECCKDYEDFRTIAFPSVKSSFSNS